MPSTGGAGVIAIVDAFHYPTAENDLGVFSAKFKLPACTKANGCFRQVFASGTQPRTSCGWSQEAALDIEWAHAMAPNAFPVLFGKPPDLDPARLFWMELRSKLCQSLP